MPNDLRFPINLATALRLSDARPLVVAAAQASVWVAEAELTHAKVLWVLTLNIGFDYVRHDGGGPDFNKGIMTAPSVNFFYAGGGLTGNGVIGNIPTADAIFEPLVARQVLNSRHWDVQTSKNDVLLQTANAYFAVHQSRDTCTGNLYTVERGRDLVGRIEQLGGELVTKVEADWALCTGIITFNGNFEGLQQTTRFGNMLVLVNRPQEAVFALQLLNVAFNEYFTTVAEYNRARFELFHALGYSASELAVLRAPVPIESVNTDRPSYLPPVGNGPPPAIVNPCSFRDWTVVWLHDSSESTEA